MTRLRMPGSIGHGQNFGLGITNRPVDSPFGLDLELKDQMTPLSPGVLDQDDWVEVATKEVFAAGRKAKKEDEDQLKVFVKVFKYLADFSGKTRFSYMKKVRKKVGKRRKRVWERVYRVDEYVKYRDKFFGSREEFYEEMEEAIKELEYKPPKSRRTLRFVVEPGGKTRRSNKKKDWQEAQNIFYTWVRKAFHKRYGDDTNYPAVIRAGASEKLKKKLDTVRANYEGSLGRGGINARPTKLKIKGRYHYRLGSISDHAVGKAIDIDPKSNPQISAGNWKRLLTYTGKSMSTGQMIAHWKSDPEKLYNHIKAVSDEFYRKSNAAIDKVEAAAKSGDTKANAATKKAEGELKKAQAVLEGLKKSKGATADAEAQVKSKEESLRKAKAAEKKAEAHKKAVDDAIKTLQNKRIRNDTRAKKSAKKLIVDAAQRKDASLRQFNDNFIIDYAIEREGFFALEWELVEELHAVGLKWGANFGNNIDLHHFELR